MRLDVEALRAFVTLVDAGSFTEAGNRLHLTQSAVSWKLKRLEERIGRPLLLKNGRALSLTEEGDVLIQHAREVLAAHDAAIAALGSRKLHGEIRLGLTEELMTRGLARIVGRFARAYPRVRLSLRVDHSRLLDLALAAGEIDLAVLQTWADEVRGEDLVLNREPLVWVAARPAVAALRPLPLVTFGPNCFYHPKALSLLQRAGQEAFVLVQAPSAATVRAAVESGLGLGVLARPAVPQAAWILPETAGLPALPEVVHVQRGDAARSPALRGLAKALGEKPLAQV